MRLHFWERGGQCAQNKIEKRPNPQDLGSAFFEKQHYLVGCVGAYTLRILPPLIITEKDCDEFICALTAAYKEAISA